MPLQSRSPRVARAVRRLWSSPVRTVVLRLLATAGLAAVAWLLGASIAHASTTDVPAPSPLVAVDHLASATDSLDGEHVVPRRTPTLDESVDTLVEPLTGSDVHQAPGETTPVPLREPHTDGAGGLIRSVAHLIPPLGTEDTPSPVRPLDDVVGQSLTADPAGRPPLASDDMATPSAPTRHPVWPQAGPRPATATPSTDPRPSVDDGAEPLAEAASVDRLDGSHHSGGAPAPSAPALPMPVSASGVGAVNGGAAAGPGPHSGSGVDDAAGYVPVMNDHGVVGEPGAVPISPCHVEDRSFSPD